MTTGVSVLMRCSVAAVLIAHVSSCTRVEGRTRDKQTAPAAASKTGAASNPAPSPPALTVTVESARTWRAYDGKTPDRSSCERWSASGMAIRTQPPIPGLPMSKLATGERKLSEGNRSYALQVKDFGARQTAPADFAEIVVRISNSGATRAVADWIAKGQKLPDARLLGASGQVQPLEAFLIPGADLAQKSLLVGCNGDGLEVALEPKETSWMLLVFKSAAPLAGAKLQLGSSPPIPVP